MQVTSNSLFHFTPSLQTLNDILKTKFKVTYCKEKFILGDDIHEYFYPMVSFCDIPLSLAETKMKTYGSYALGLTKDWGIKNNLNPVVYVERNSFLAKDIMANYDNMEIISDLVGKKNDRTWSLIIKHIDTLRKTTIKNNKDLFTFINEAIKGLKDEDKLLEEKLLSQAHSWINLLRYIKNYQGQHPKNADPNSQYRFYDEREWRFVPEMNKPGFHSYLNAKEYKKFRGTNKKPFIPNISLLFTSEDIKYILVKSNKDVPKVIRIIKSIENLTKNADDSDILTTKIITQEQLRDDF